MIKVLIFASLNVLASTLSIYIAITLQTEEGNARILVLRKWIMRLPDNTRFPVPAYSVAIALRNSHATIGAVEILNGNDEVIGYIALWVQTDAFSARMLRR